MKGIRRHLTSVALLFAAGGIVTYAYLDRGAVTESEKKQREGSVLVAWRKDDLSRIELARRDGSLILERVREDGGDRSWFLRAPRAERADDAAVERLVAALEMASVLRKVDGDSAPGLDAPRVRGTLTMGDVVDRLELGAEAPTPPGAAYLRVQSTVAGEASPPHVVVVSRDLAAALLQTDAAYRGRAVVPYLSIELAAMTVKGTATQFSIERVDEISFKGPGGVRVSRQRLDAAWSALAAMRAESFLPDEDADRATTTPRFVIAMTPREGAKPRGELRVGDACPGQPDGVVVVRTAPSRLSACVPKAALEGLALTDSALEDDALFVAHEDEVAELRLQSVPGRTLDVARKESGWHERAPDDRDLSPDEVEATADRVRAVVKTRGVAPRLGAPVFEVRGRVVLVRADAPGPELVEIGPADAEGEVPVRRTFDGATLQVSRAAARALLPHAVTLRPRALWSPPIEGQPVRALSTECDGVRQRLTARADGWSLDEPPGFAPDRAAVLELLDLVARARADAWVADADDGTFGLDGPRCRIALTLEGDAGATREAEIAFGRAADDETPGGTAGASVYARTDGAVLAAPAYLRDRARTWLVDRHAFAIPTDAAVTLKRRGVVTVPSEAARAALAALVPTEVVHLGPARPDEGLDARLVDVVARAPRDSGDARPTHFVLGREVHRGGVAGYFARMDGVDASFFVPADDAAALVAP